MSPWPSPTRGRLHGEGPRPLRGAGRGAGPSATIWPAPCSWEARADDRPAGYGRARRGEPLLMVELLGITIGQQSLVLGLVTGLTYAAFAAGFVLIYRSTGVLNFAHGEVGAFGVALFVLLLAKYSVNWWLSFVLALAACAAIGMAVELIVIRRLFKLAPLGGADRHHRLWARSCCSPSSGCPASRPRGRSRRRSRRRGRPPTHIRPAGPRDRGAGGGPRADRRTGLVHRPYPFRAGRAGLSLQRRHRTGLRHVAPPDLDDRVVHLGRVRGGHGHLPGPAPRHQLGPGRHPRPSPSRCC